MKGYRLDRGIVALRVGLGVVLLERLAEVVVVAAVLPPSYHLVCHRY